MQKRIRTIQVMDEEGTVTTMNVPLSIVRTPYNSNEFPKNYEKNTMPSATVPNMAMTVKELIARFASGMPLSLGKAPVYENGEFPDIEEMDLIERHEYYKELKARKEAAEERITKARTKAEEMKMDKIVKERVEMRLKEEAEAIAKKHLEERKGGQI